MNERAHLKEEEEKKGRLEKSIVTLEYKVRKKNKRKK